jgi:hypothetical protein
VRSTHDTLSSTPSSPSLAHHRDASVITRAPAPPSSPWTPQGLPLPAPLALASRVIFFLPWCIAVGAAIALHPRLLTPLVRMYAGPWPTPLHRLAHHAHTAHAHIGIFLGTVSVAAMALPSWSFRAALVGALAARTVAVWRGFGTRVGEQRTFAGREGEKGNEDWREDARCVWRVLRGEEEREILRVCGEDAVRE